MSTEILLMASPGSSRALDAAIPQSPSLPVKQLDPKTPPLLTDACRTASSSRASTPLSSVMDVDNMSTEPSSPPSAQASAVKPESQPPKRKLTFAEKEAFRLEKQWKSQQKAEEKARKDAQREEEKREKEEKKRLEAAEKEAKRQQKEIEKTEKRKTQEAAKEEKRKVKEEKQAQKQAEIAAKESEKKAKEDERAKQQRSQLRLNAFFVKSAPSAGSASSSRRNSIASIQGSPLKKELITFGDDAKKELSEYEKAFPPFFVKENVILAPQSRFEYDEERLRYSHTQLDNSLNNQLEAAPSLKRTFEDAIHEPFAKRRKLGSKTTIKELVSQINAESSTIDLTESAASTKDAFAALRAVPMKYLRYAEDIRPPYIGTYTKQPVDCTVQRLCRRPFTRALPGVNYDYDSEAEWEEPEEGDDCESDDEDSEVDEEDEDMAYFLDDEDDAPKRRNVMGDMEPISTNLFWQEPKHHRGEVKVPYGMSTLDLSLFRISPLLVEATGSIDPFSTAYWKAPEPERSSNSNSMAPPPRVASNPSLGSNSRLSANPGTGLTLKPPPNSVNNPVSLPQKAKASAKPFPPELLDDFKREIEGSDLSKVGLVEVLKKRFPQLTGKTIQETLPLVAKRDGKNHAEKKWVLV